MTTQKGMQVSNGKHYDCCELQHLKKLKGVNYGKMHSLVVSNNNWLNAWLTQRLQCAVINGYESRFVVLSPFWCLSGYCSWSADVLIIY